MNCRAVIRSPMGSLARSPPSALELVLAQLQSAAHRSGGICLISRGERWPFAIIRASFEGGVGSQAPAILACMRKLIVSNFLTLDGYYESADKRPARPRPGGRVAPDHLPCDRRRGNPAVHRPPARLTQAAVHPDLGRLRQHPCDLRADPVRTCAGKREPPPHGNGLRAEIVVRPPNGRESLSPKTDAAASASALSPSAASACCPGR